MESKKCSICKESKPTEQFQRKANSKDGFQPRCTTCKQTKERANRDPIYSRRANLKRFYNMTLEDYEVMFKNQGGVCAICGEVETSPRVSNLTVDHCHDTNKVRGLLCNNCNRGIGLLKDSAETLRKATQYLEKHYAKNTTKP